MKPVHCFFALAATILVVAAAATASGAPAKETTPAHLRELLVAANFDEALKLAKPAARWPDYANGSEGLIQTNTPILLDWDVCAPRGGTNPAPALHPTVFRYPWLEFVQASNGLTATLHLRVDAWPKTEWKTRLQRVDRGGFAVIVLQTEEKLIRNSGTIEKYPHQEDLEATFQLSNDAEFHAWPGMLYQISLETVWTEQGNPVRWGEAMPLALDLPTSQRSWVFRAESLSLEKLGNAVQATVQAEVISWPKSRWRLALELSDAQGKRVGHADQVVENGGVIISRPSFTHEAFQFTLPSELGGFDAAHRWTLRVESLPQSRGPEDQHTSTAAER